MEFKEQYLTYNDYKALGGTLDQVPFNLLEYDVRKKIDERTQGRLINIEPIPKEVKMCVFKMIDVLDKYQPLETQDKTIISENTDGYSVSYKKLEKSDIDVKNEELKDIMMSYLSNVIVNKIPVLYLGVDEC